VELPVNTIIHGKCLDALRTLPDASVDAIVTDPPYGLGTREPTIEEMIAYLNGANLDLGEFMNKDWEIPSVPVWRECFRVLKPGGHLLSFAATKTQDIISIGLRAAGFEKRDEIDVEFGPPVFRWIRAQGMPKSTDIGKAIDKKLGVERPVVGTKRGKGGENLNKIARPGKGDTEEAKGVGAYGAGAKQVDVDLPVTTPGSSEAAKWEGWGTALKPYWEPILMFRKPIDEGTVAEQVMATGTGGINIEASRVKHSSKEDFEKHKAGVDAIKARGGSMANSWKNSSDLSGANEVTTSGRYPPNVLFVHSDACKKTGTTKVAAHVINRFDDGAKPFGNGAGHQYTTTPMGDENGQEEIEVWDCHPACPITTLNKQREGASRYFPNFEPDALFQYVPKPNAGEKNSGLDPGEENEHVTVKPVMLMRYLVRMVTPKDGLVLDPYCGSGTTCVAATEEGFNFIGIEKEEPSVVTARARTLKTLEEVRVFRQQQEIHRLAFALPNDDEAITP
jgi:site-specific DNA-methyltransferase (adenine-specific)